MASQSEFTDRQKAIFEALERFGEEGATTPQLFEVCRAAGRQHIHDTLIRGLALDMVTREVHRGRATVWRIKPKSGFLLHDVWNVAYLPEPESATL